MSRHLGLMRLVGVPQHLFRLLALALLFALAVPSSTHAATSRAPHAHVYLIRGVLNVFSLGMDAIAARLERQGISTTVANHLAWSALSDEAAAEYKSGKARTIILVGHSAGAGAVTDMVNRLGQLGVPVRLAIGLDPLSHAAVTGHADKYINFYTGAGSPVDKAREFRGTLENVDLRQQNNVGHFTIDKNAAIEAKVIAQIRAAVYGR